MKKKNIWRFLTPPLVILFGILVMAGLTSSRKKPTRMTPVFTGVLAEVSTAKPDNRMTFVRGHGTVQPRYQVNLAAQVSGKVDWVHPQFATGGEFSKGELMVRIEKEDYVLAVDQARARVVGAEYGLAVAKANANIARQEWETMQKAKAQLSLPGTVPDQKPDALVLREPQLRQAEADLASAEAALRTAELKLSRTDITAPFNCRIRQKMVDPGQYVNIGTSTASLYSTDLIEIEVGVQQSELRWVKVPGATAIVKMNLNGDVYSWEGRVDRSAGVIDERQRLARLIVQVKNPFRARAEFQPELSIGSFVEVEIEGIELSNIIPLPRQTLHDKSTIWLMKADSTLEFKNVTVKRYTPTEIFISNGLNPGDQVIVSAIPGAAPGLKLRPIRQGQPQNGNSGRKGAGN